MPAAGVNFLGQGRTNSPTTVTGTPPHPVGAVGPNHYVQVVNGGIEVWNKNGTVLQASKAVRTLWTGYVGTNPGNACSVRNDGDPIVRYDRLADRWIVTQFSLPNSSSGSSFQCVAVSKSGDPTGAYWLYDFVANPAGIGDNPKLGVWPDAYYLTSNLFNGSGFTYAGTQVCAWDRAKMLAGQAATQQCFQTSANYLSLLPADLDGAIQTACAAGIQFVARVKTTITVQ